MAAFKKATKAQSKLRLALCGLAGSGKTWTMLAIATAMAEEMRRLGHGDGRIALIDTEHESASLYADHFDFDTMPLDTYSPRAYVEAIGLAEREGYDFCIIDSLSHAWSGKDGALEQKDNAIARGDGNDFTAWRGVSTMHNNLVDRMLSCRMHLLVSMRTHMEYSIDKDERGKSTIKKIGLAAIQRKGMEYEFTAVGDMDLTSLHTMKISKTRIHGVLDIDDQFDRPGRDLALRIYGWLMNGAVPVARARDVETPIAPTTSISQDLAVAIAGIDTASSLEQLEALVPSLRTLTGEAAKERNRRYKARKAWLTERIVAVRAIQASQIGERPSIATAINDSARKQPAPDDAAELEELQREQHERSHRGYLARDVEVTDAVVDAIETAADREQPHSPAPEAA